MTAPTLPGIAEACPSPMVRSTDGPTSRIAAKRVKIGPGQEAVLAALRDLCASMGSATDRQIEAHPLCGWLGRGSAIKRRLELERLGLVERVGHDFTGRTPMLTFRVVPSQEHTK